MQALLQPVSILGTGAYLPPDVLTNRDLEKMVETTDEWIRTRTGISERRILRDKTMCTSDMAFEAGRQAMAMAQCPVEDIDLIIVCTYTPDHLFPPTACLVQAKLGATRAAAFDLEVACSGFIYGLTTGAQFIATGTYKRVLVIGAEYNSRMVDWTDRNTCVIFGDGAGAALLGPGKDGGELISWYLGADGRGASLIIMEGGGAKHRPTHETIDKKMHYIHMDGKETFKNAVKVMGETALEALSRAGLKETDLDLLIPHQANTRIIDATAHRLKLPPEKVFINIHKYGNTAAAATAIALDEALRTERIKLNSHSVVVAFGGGLSWGSLCIRWNKLPTV